jgi:shikimate kinase
MRPLAVLPCRCIVLIGFMGAGKTTTGAVLARLLDWRFVDLDDGIADESGKSVADIFDHHGEAHFRAAETRHLARYLQPGNAGLVLALGGGTLDLEENRKLLAAAPDTCVIYLEAPLAELLARCHRQANGHHQQSSSMMRSPVRPLLSEAEIRFEQRAPLYESIGTAVSTYGFSAEDVASNIVGLLQMRGGADSR